MQNVTPFDFVHITCRAHAVAALSSSLPARSILIHASRNKLIDRALRDLREAGKDPLVIRVAADGINVRDLEPDLESIEEPLTTLLAVFKEEVHDRWAGCGQTWRDCVDLVGTCRTTASIPARFLVVSARRHTEQLAA